jgi:hypothetical protein
MLAKVLGQKKLKVPHFPLSPSHYSYNGVMVGIFDCPKYKSTKNIDHTFEQFQLQKGTSVKV